jgi:adenine-specific DNA methylase
VKEFERAGISAIHLEDQVMPKKCGHLEGKKIIPTEEIGISNYDRGHRLYGIHSWPDFFNPRQLHALVHLG